MFYDYRLVFIACALGSVVHAQTGVFRKDDTSASTPWQVVMTGTSDSNIQLISGVNTSATPFGSLQAFKQSVGPLPLVLQNTGGSVGIGTSSPFGGLDVRSGGGQIFGNSLYFWASGLAPDGMPFARLIENWGMRFAAPDSRFVLATKTALLVGYAATGQDWGTGNFFVSGNVGVGTTSPGAKVHIMGPALGSSSGNTSSLLTLQNTNGNLNFLKIYQLRNSTGEYWTTATTRIQQVTDACPQAYIEFNPANDGWGLAFGTNGSEYMRIRSDGNVGIGTTNPTQKLSVNGTVRAKEVIVEISGWSDYVFSPEYVLPSLSEVERQIQRERHLPGMPSAAEVSEKGISLGVMQARLLAAIEELTLRQIEQDKRLTAQQEELSTLRTRNLQLERRVAELTR